MLLLNYTPFDWYWFIGGGGPNLDDNGNYTTDDTRVFSSARNHYFPSDDATYVAWRQSKIDAVGLDIEPTSRIDTEANLTLVLQPFGIVPDFS